MFTRAFTSVTLALTLISACDDPDGAVDDDADEIGFRASAGDWFINRTFAVNAHGGKVFMWDYDPSDPEQEWIRDASAISDDDTRQALGTNLCLNAYKPAAGSAVNLYPCSKGDADQRWEYIWCADDDNPDDNTYVCNIRRQGSGYCLNAYKPSPGSKLTMWPCNSGDLDQRFTIPTTVPNGGA